MLRPADIRAERILAEELRRRGWQEADLAIRRRNDPEKWEIAARLRRETTLSVTDIAALVRLGTAKTANTNLHGYMRRGSKPAAGQAQLGR